MILGLIFAWLLRHEPPQDPPKTRWHSFCEKHLIADDPDEFDDRDDPPRRD